MAPFYFTTDDGVNGYELWRSDGTTEGTVMVTNNFVDTWFRYGYEGPTKLTNVNGTLYFTASDGINGKQLWKSDGTAEGTVRLTDAVFTTQNSRLVTDRR